jgi:hypothetical protein
MTNLRESLRLLFMPPSIGNAPSRRLGDVPEVVPEIARREQHLRDRFRDHSRDDGRSVTGRW